MEESRLVRTPCPIVDKDEEDVGGSVTVAQETPR